jgi:hypothetical protein
MKGDPAEGALTGFVDSMGLGTTLDQALGAAAALAQALPSAAAQIAATLQAYFAEHPGTAPPDWLYGAELLLGLPPGMTLEQYIQLHTQYRVPSGQTYARVGTGASPPSGPGDPAGPPGGGFGGGGGPGDPGVGPGGGGAVPTSSDPYSTPGEGNPTRPGQGPDPNPFPTD